jgi:hypothetical protein
MRRTIIALGLFVVMTGTAEAGVGDWVKNSWTFATQPINCVLELGKDLIAAGTKFVTCVISNVNRNPATLDKLIELP